MISGEKSILYTPYTLLEAEALGWCLLFSDQVIFLHPFPLELPEACQKLKDRGLIRILTPPRTPEEIRQMEKRLRDFQRFGALNPDFSFLEYLKQVKPGKHLESQDEILDLLRGKKPETREVQDPSGGAAGEILLGLIHDWITREWEIGQSLDRLEKQEEALAGIMETGFEFSPDWAVPGTSFVTPVESELYSPPALKAWKKLEETLGPEAPCLLTTQAWVWRDYYRTDPETVPAPSLSLPGWPSPSVDSFLKDLQSWSEAGRLQPIREIFWDLLSGSLPDGQKIKDLHSAVEALSLPEPGRYALVLPPFPSPVSEAGAPLLLLTRTL